MGALSFVVADIGSNSIKPTLFQFIQPMAIGFLAYAAFKAYHISIKNTITQIVMLVSLLGTYLLFKTPWIIPALIICGAIVTNFSSRRIPEKEVIKPKQIRWTNIWVFVLVFIVAGFKSTSISVLRSWSCSITPFSKLRKEVFPNSTLF